MRLPVKVSRGEIWQANVALWMFMSGTRSTCIRQMVDEDEDEDVDVWVFSLVEVTKLHSRTRPLLSRY